MRKEDAGKHMGRERAPSYRLRSALARLCRDGGARAQLGERCRHAGFFIGIKPAGNDLIVGKQSSASGDRPEKQSLPNCDFRGKNKR